MDTAGPDWDGEHAGMSDVAVVKPSDSPQTAKSEQVNARLERSSAFVLVFF